MRFFFVCTSFFTRLSLSRAPLEILDWEQKKGNDESAGLCLVALRTHIDSGAAGEERPEGTGRNKI
jgi:hypothetical protein